MLLAAHAISGHYSTLAIQALAGAEAPATLNLLAQSGSSSTEINLTAGGNIVLTTSSGFIDIKNGLKVGPYTVADPTSGQICANGNIYSKGSISADYSLSSGSNANIAGGLTSARRRGGGGEIRQRTLRIKWP
jgi:hypothetical protein